MPKSRQLQTRTKPSDVRTVTPCPQRNQELERILFFFQAEDGIRDWSVTGVQTCALPICSCRTTRPPRCRGSPRECDGSSWLRDPKGYGVIIGSVRADGFQRREIPDVFRIVPRSDPLDD